MMINALASRILTEKSSNGKLNAVGVEFIVSGKRYVVNAKEEVLVCAGCVFFNCSALLSNLRTGFPYKVP